MHMGIWDWLKKKPEEPDEKPAEIIVDLPELDKDALLEETKSVFESDNEDVKELQLVDATPEYDTGEVEIDDLLDDEMSSNYELNTVDEAEYEDLLVDAEIIGDLPSEVSFES